MFKQITSCRICNSKNLSKYLDLGKLPLANSLIDPEKKEKEHFFPLEVLFCNDCCLSQLSIVVDPEIMFNNYVYRASVSKTFQNHCREMAKEIKKRFKTQKLSVLDIASNDGCLLKEFKKENFEVIGVEPAANIAKIAEENKITTINSFWNKNAVKKVLNKTGKVDVVTATNVLAHVHDISSFVSVIKEVLKENGLVVIEVPNAHNIIEKNQFDTIYHEHLSYFIFKPLIELFERNDFELVDVQKVNIHGGSLRIFAAKKNSSVKKNKEAVNELIQEEKSKGLYELKTYLQLAKNAERIKNDLILIMKEIKSKGKTIAAYGASAKGSTLLNYCGVGTNYIDFIVDDTPEKQNHLTPGNHIPIFSKSYLEENKTDYLLLLSWNFAKEFISKTPEHREKGGKYIIPIPEVKVIESEDELE